MICNFVGFCNLNRDLSSNAVKTLSNITKDLSHQLIDEKDMYISQNYCLGYIYNFEKDKQEINFRINDNKYTIIFNGKIYNSKEIRNELVSLGYEFNRII